MKFETPICFLGTDFKKKVWKTLHTTSPFGFTRIYTKHAQSISHALGANYLLLIVPSYRVVCSNGSLGGYRAGVERKNWLISHEKKHYYNTKAYPDDIKHVHKVDYLHLHSDEENHH